MRSRNDQRRNDCRFRFKYVCIQITERIAGDIVITVAVGGSKMALSHIEFSKGVQNVFLSFESVFIDDLELSL